MSRVEAGVSVVTDTSILLNLCRVSAEGLLAELFREVWIPPTVATEFSQQAAGRARFQVLALPDWLRISTAIPAPPAVQACPDLDASQTEAFSLALELRAAAVVLDEMAARRAAIRLQLPCVGLGGILLRAREQGLIPTIRPVLSRLRVKAGYSLSPPLENEVLRLAGEL